MYPAVYISTSTIAVPCTKALAALRSLRTEGCVRTVQSTPVHCVLQRICKSVPLTLWLCAFYKDETSDCMELGLMVRQCKDGPLNYTLKEPL